MLEVSHLRVAVGAAVLVRDASFAVDASQVHALVGESGSGKTSIARALVGLAPTGAAVTGQVRLNGVDWPRHGVVWVPQDAASALNPAVSVRAHLAESVSVHQGARGAALDAEVESLLASVGFSVDQGLLAKFPHQLSGGMRQRVLLAAALGARPSVVIADEPTTALDAPLRRQVLDELKAMAAARSLGVVLITHDLSGVEHAADQLSVLYAGSIVEQGACAQLLTRPRHPYTRALLAARAFKPIAGMAPSPSDELPGCRFAPRCDRADGRCVSTVPMFDGRVACFNPEGP
jgi:oligopeptide/dipeptide ABC transporter ATP-binding protein